MTTTRMPSTASSAPPGTGWDNSATSYGRIARALHWAMAALMLAVVPMGLYCASLRGVAGREGEREAWLLVHKSIGLLLLVLAFARAAWALQQPRPGLPQSMPLHERWLARGVHVSLYAMLFLSPLSGLLLSQGAGQPVTFFGLFTLPQFVPIDASLPAAERPQVIAGVILHKVVLKYALLSLFALHVLGVLKHAFVDRDPTLWTRMWGWR